MALVEVSACCSHKEQHHAHTQDKEHAVTTGLSALKGKIPHMWKPNPMGEALHPMGPFASSINHSNVIRQPTPAWQMGTQNIGKDRI